MLESHEGASLANRARPQFGRVWSSDPTFPFGDQSQPPCSSLSIRFDQFASRCGRLGVAVPAVTSALCSEPRTSAANKHASQRAHSTARADQCRRNADTAQRSGGARPAVTMAWISVHTLMAVDPRTANRTVVWSGTSTCDGVRRRRVGGVVIDAVGRSSGSAAAWSRRPRRGLPAQRTPLHSTPLATPARQSLTTH